MTAKVYQLASLMVFTILHSFDEMCLSFSPHGFYSNAKVFTISLNGTFREFCLVYSACPLQYALPFIDFNDKLEFRRSTSRRSRFLRQTTTELFPVSIAALPQNSIFF